MKMGPGFPSNTYNFKIGKSIIVIEAENQYKTIIKGITLGSTISGMYRKATGPIVTP